MIDMSCIGTRVPSDPDAGSRRWTGRRRHRDRWCPRRVHRRGDSRGLCRAGRVRQRHAMLRPGRSQGAVVYGAGLSRHLLESSEIVIALDRLKRTSRRNGAKSDPLDAIRAAREPMARPRLGTPAAAANASTVSAPDCSPLRDRASTEAQLQVVRLGSTSSNRSAPGSVARSSPRCSTLPRTCACTPSWDPDAGTRRCDAPFPHRLSVRRAPHRGPDEDRPWVSSSSAPRQA